ncbi:MAG: hypothetical protein J6S49_08930 [Erysipelotrichaceae bacterium]|nr:hypothetical protein [Erysipelotrichaceae bacterium]
MKNYTASVSYTSRELTKKETVRLKDLTDAIALDSATNEGENLVIKPAYSAILDIHNENARDKDYKKYVIVTEDGLKFVTGSESFWDAFTNIVTEMEDSDEEWSLNVYKVPSKKYAGKGFLTCSVI